MVAASHKWKTGLFSLAGIRHISSRKVKIMYKPFKRERTAVSDAAAQMSAMAERAQRAIDMLCSIALAAMGLFFVVCLYHVGGNH
jgi:hypothetical protein